MNYSENARVCLLIKVTFILQIVMVNSILFQRYRIFAFFLPGKLCLFINIDDERTKPTSICMSAGNKVAVVKLPSYISVLIFHFFILIVRPLSIPELSTEFPVFPIATNRTRRVVPDPTFIFCRS